MSVSKRRRFEVFKRDLFTCQYCGRRPPDVVLEVDHIVPRCEGGSDEMENLTTSCAPYNRGKAGVPLGEVAPALNELEQLEALQEMAERRRALEQQIVVAERVRELDQKAIDTVAGWWEEEFGNLDRFDDSSIRRFLKDLKLEEIYEAINAAAGLSTRHPLRVWKYFCGACRGMIREKGNDG